MVIQIFAQVIINYYSNGSYSDLNGLICLKYYALNY